MDILLKTRCNKGHLVVYEDRIAVELSMMGIRNSNSLPFDKITGIELNTTMARIPIICVGYATVKIFATGSQTIEVKMVKLADAEKLEEIVRQKTSSKS